MTFPNLAGHPEATKIVTSELIRCGIEPIAVIEPIDEPRATVYGVFFCELGKFKFERAWYYYRADGLVPVELARLLYADPVGRADIRVNGHCGCPPPEGWALRWILPDGRHVASTESGRTFRHWAEHGESPSIREMGREGLEKFVFDDDPASTGAAAFVEHYHIDSELGLYKFVEALRAYRPTSKGAT